MAPISDTLQRQLDLAKIKVRRAVEDGDLELKALELKEKAEETIRKYPIHSLIAGAAIGFFLGKLFSVSEDDD
ncbi:hypothetical protein EP331_07075 [bacterium]|nr:MAG: hypothetical protein EP331_07075 [bacterium]